MKIYEDLRDKYTKNLVKSTYQYNLISLIRLLLAIAFISIGYFYLDAPNTVLLFFLVLLVLAFGLLIRVHDKLRKIKQMQAALLKVNEKEIDYLKNKNIPFEDGAEYVNTQHPYSYDIDIFGTHSIFQHINRTASYLGKERLAQFFLQAASPETICSRQKANAELQQKINFRQKINATASIKRDSKVLYDNILRWSKMEQEALPPYILVFTYILIAIFLGLCVARFILGPSIFGSLLIYSFIINLIFLYSQLKKIQRQIIAADQVRHVIHQYGIIIQTIEEEKFESVLLKQLQQKLNVKSTKVSQELTKLARLFNSLDAIQNIVGAVLFNGVFLYHIHILSRLLQWKKEYGSTLLEWLEVIGDIEALSSLANFAYNNPTYCFPSINEQHQIEFKGLGHPLLASAKRVDNDIQFTEHSFIILTGSNMSGKSTFLRALGVNMVLAGMGSVICAKSATIHPLPILVSMRLTDSLNDSESYFFAEVKRLKEIMDALEKNPAFVLLDEILRGTNSDDKRNGTIEVIKKMLQKGVLGAIATHDLEVCKTVDLYPNNLVNKAFEVEIVNNELQFDYTLRDGICQNQSASFLMKKMGVI